MLHNSGDKEEKDLLISGDKDKLLTNRNRDRDREKLLISGHGEEDRLIHNMFGDGHICGGRD